MVTPLTTAVALGLVLLVMTWFLLPAHWARILLWLGRRAAGMKSARASTGGLEWHYLEGGHGPALVAIHGFGADADHWLRVAPTLRRHFRIVAPDLVGFGESSAGDDLRYDIDAQVERLHSLLQHLCIDSCVMAGSSMGGWVASRYAQRFPQAVRALWLLAPLGVQDCERGELLQRIDLGTSNPLAIRTVAEFEHRVFRPMFYRPPRLPRPLKMHYGRRAIARSAASMRMFAEVIASRMALEDIVAELGIPVLVQWGVADRAVHVSGAARLEQAINSGAVIMHAGMGHLPMLEAGQRTVDEFIAFSHRHGITSPPPEES